MADTFSMAQPEGVGHQYTPPLLADVTPQDNPPVGVNDAAAEYGQLCIGARDAALAKRQADFERLLPGA